jgi:D-alanine-D-alanine ligase
MDKVASRQRFVAAGLAVPQWRAVPSHQTDGLDLNGWRFPLMVKPSAQGSSIGVSRVAHPGDLPSALREAGRHGTTILIEEFIQGRELTVGILGAQPLPIVEIRPKQGFFDFTAKYTVGMTEYHVPAALKASIAARVQEAGRRAHEAIGCRHFSRTDVILNPSNVPVILEVNTIPGLTPTSLLPKAAACAGMSYAELCEQLVRMACPPTNLALRTGKLSRSASAARPREAGTVACGQVGGGV